VLLEGREVSPWRREGSETKEQGTGGTNLTMNRNEEFGSVSGTIHSFGIRGDIGSTQMSSQDLGVVERSFS
jgi:hypothetical protein